MNLKQRALYDYGEFVGTHGRLVRDKWIRGKEIGEHDVLAAQEIDPVADTLAMYQAIRSMRAAPINRATIMMVLLPSSSQCSR
jgi:hypothetical protein